MRSRPKHGTVGTICTVEWGRGMSRESEGMPSLRQRLLYTGGRIGGGVYDGFNTASRVGRRKPFMLVGAPLSVVFLLLAARAGHAGGSIALPLVALAIVLFSIFYNVAGDPYDALMVDIVPPRGRATFNAVLNIVSLSGYVGITLYAIFASVKKNSIPDTVFYVTAAAILLGYALVVFGVREPA